MHANLSRPQGLPARTSPWAANRGHRIPSRAAATAAWCPDFSRPSSAFTVQPDYYADINKGSDLGWATNFKDHYVKGKLIGTGSFGNVFLGIALHTGQEVAVKIMPKIRGKLTKERTLQKLNKEVTVLETLQDCPNVVQLSGCYEDQDNVYVVTEMCSGGDLQRLSDERGPLSEQSLALVAYEVLRVIAACHEHGIVHGDIKPANFCIKSRQRSPLINPEAPAGSSWLRAIDFGCSQLLEGEQRCCSLYIQSLNVHKLTCFPRTAGNMRFAKRTGTPVYMAPEVFERDYSIEADMWSLGIMMYQLYSRRFPFWDSCGGCKATNLEEVMVAVLDGDIPFDYGSWLSMSMEGRDFISRCLSRDVESRLTVSQAVNHPWIQQFIGAQQRTRELQAPAMLSSNNIVSRGLPAREKQPVA